MIMVAHDGIGAQINSKYGAQQLDAIDDPLAAMLKIKSCVDILATQEGPPDASGDAMVIGRVFQRDLAVSGLRHRT